MATLLLLSTKLQAHMPYTPPPHAATLWRGQASATVVLQINLHGKAQQQHMDRRWYIALRQVKVLGRRLDPAEIRRLQLQAPPRQQADW